MLVHSLSMAYVRGLSDQVLKYLAFIAITGAGGKQTTTSTTGTAPKQIVLLLSQVLA